MKNLCFILLLTSILTTAQELPQEFYQTWYLHTLLPSDGYNEPFLTSDIQPEINPYITINENLDFTGEGACNSFSGTFVINENGQFETTNFSSTESTCANDAQTELENAFFTTIQNNRIFYSNISEIENGLLLEMETSIFGHLTFYNYHLSVNSLSNKDLNIQISPNPATNFINIVTKENIRKITLFNSDQKIILEQTNSLDKVSISHLPKGVYFIKIATESSVCIEKVIKK